MPSPLDLPSLHGHYTSHPPLDVIEDLLGKLAARGTDGVWITRAEPDHVRSRARSIEALPTASRSPIWGVPFAIKDNIDFAGLPTTAACPRFAYTPSEHSPVVQRLLDAGAIALGKTNLDQFATGLVGVRSPYGIPINPFNAAYIPGGSSSGSAVAVAAGLCSFALGTDTAGSGRVPAAFNNLVGLKPTRGLLSTRGMVPACRSLDCVSIFTRTVGDAAEILKITAGYDPIDSFSRTANPPIVSESGRLRVGVPRASQLEFFGNTEAARLFAGALAHWRQLGATLVEIDYSPFRDAARLLYDGPWVAERYAAVGLFLEHDPSAFHPITRKIIEGARSLSAARVFESSYALAALRRRADRVWDEIDVLVTPTAGTPYTLEEVEAEPVRLNSHLGYYTNHMNLLDLCGLAIPAGFLPNGMPWGITLSAPAFCDDRLLRLGAQFLGEEPPTRALYSPEATTRLAVCGAHLSGLPLNPQLTQLGARLVSATRTSPHYRFYALPGTVPPKPGLVRVASDGAPIEVEVWEMSHTAFGLFVSKIPSPLGIGTIELCNGEKVQSFLCESYAVSGAQDITSFGGWRAFLSQR